MGHLEGNFTPVLYIGRKVPKGFNSLTQQYMANGINSTGTNVSDSSVSYRQMLLQDELG